MKNAKILVLSLVLLVAGAMPVVVSADAPWWCNTSFGSWWGPQNCRDTGGQAGVLVYVQPQNQYDRVQLPSDYTVVVEGTSPSPGTFQGSLSGTPVVLGAGPYAVRVANTNFYTATYSAGCSGQISAGQHQLCVVTVSTSAPYFGEPIPYPYPYTNIPLTCAPSFQTVTLDQTVSFTANGGYGGAYNWVTPTHTYTNVGPRLATTFQTTGIQNVSVTSGGMSATCSLNVLASAYYGGMSQIFPNTSVAAPVVYQIPPTQPVIYQATYQGVKVPNTGFEPEDSASVGFAMMLLVSASLLLFPYVRKTVVSIVS